MKNPGRRVRRKSIQELGRRAKVKGTGAGRVKPVAPKKPKRG